MWPQQVINLIGKLNIHTEGVWKWECMGNGTPASFPADVTGNLNEVGWPGGPLAGKIQQVMIFHLKEAAEVNKKSKRKKQNKQSRSGSWKMGGVLFSNFYFYICAGKQREEQKKSTYWITGGAGTLVFQHSA